ncbi:PQQ-dependent sugar dehydrogenase [Atopococcus tabaci]|uniref:PQQ-dependent sugar dehydrogenase n=1 Tax=Atopococcus tabaci TaxID=269774 RepID=UPI002409C756|nr:PQQ-dependent sugar dehydrogenase [Atopococcus tabaci]
MIHSCNMTYSLSEEGVDKCEKMLWLIPFLLMACSSGEEASPDSGSSQPDRSPEKQIDLGLLTLLEAHPHLSFEEPLHYEVLPDTGKAFVVERQGIIQMFDAQEDAEQAEVFLDLSDVISASGSEMGLLGLALHPEFEANGYFFVNYTTEEGTVIARLQADPETFSVDENTQTTLLAFPQPYPNHNGGHLAFGTDGYLYIGVGDGGGSGDPEDNAQDLNELYGKLLRIDVDETSSGRPYAIPADNPFAENGEGIREEIFACGLRNPWKFSFDEERQWLWLADVGQNRLEEINVIESGQNYGSKRGIDGHGFDDFFFWRRPRRGSHSCGLQWKIVSFRETRVNESTKTHTANS